MIKKNIFTPVYDETETPPAPPAPPAPPVEPPRETEFTKEQQEIVNKMLEEQKDKSKTLVSELQSLQQKFDHKSEQYKALDKQIVDLKKSLMTKEELLKEEKHKAEAEYQQRIESLENQAKSWETKFTETVLDTSILQASVQNNAYNPSQIRAIIRPITVLKEVINEQGEPTGNYVPEVTLKTVNDKGENVELVLSPDDAIKKMREMDEYRNLFRTDGKGGFGLPPSKGTNGELDLLELAKNPEAYARARKEGKIKL